MTVHIFDFFEERYETICEQWKSAVLLFEKKKTCEDLLCAVIIMPYKKLSTNYWKVTAY